MMQSEEAKRIRLLFPLLPFELLYHALTTLTLLPETYQPVESAQFDDWDAKFSLQGAAAEQGVEWGITEVPLFHLPDLFVCMAATCGVRFTFLVRRMVDLGALSCPEGLPWLIDSEYSTDYQAMELQAKNEEDLKRVTEFLARRSVEEARFDITKIYVRREPDSLGHRLLGDEPFVGELVSAMLHNPACPVDLLHTLDLDLDDSSRLGGMLAETSANLIEETLRRCTQVACETLTAELDGNLLKRWKTYFMKWHWTLPLWLVQCLVKAMTIPLYTLLKDASGEAIGKLGHFFWDIHEKYPYKDERLDVVDEFMHQLLTQGLKEIENGEWKSAHKIYRLLSGLGAIYPRKGTELPLKDELVRGLNTIWRKDVDQRLTVDSIMDFIQTPKDIATFAGQFPELSMFRDMETETDERYFESRKTSVKARLVHKREFYTNISRHVIATLRSLGWSATNANISQEL